MDKSLERILAQTLSGLQPGSRGGRLSIGEAWPEIEAAQNSEAGFGPDRPGRASPRNLVPSGQQQGTAGLWMGVGGSFDVWAGPKNAHPMDVSDANRVAVSAGSGAQSAGNECCSTCVCSGQVVR